MLPVIERVADCPSVLQNAAKVGVGVMIESSSLTPEELGLPPQL
jgi:hypothetical protein